MKYLIWILSGIIMSFIINKFIFKKNKLGGKLTFLGVIGAIFLSLLLNILGIKYNALSFGNIFIAFIGAFVAIFSARKQLE